VLKNKNRSLSLIVLVSISLHLALFTVLYLGKRKSILPVEKPPIIQAELLFVDTSSFLPTEELLQQEDEISTIEATSELPAVISEENTEIEVQAAELEEAPFPAEPDLEKKPVEDEPTDTQTPESEQATESPLIDDTLPALEAAKNQKNIFQQPLQDIAKSQLNSYRQSKLNSLAAQAASEYRQQRDHPKLGAAESDSFLTEEERFEQKMTTSVDCSSASSQTLATVAGFMGGRVKCSEPPPFDAFIQKRLNKTAELPAMQNQDNSNQP
jgi:hypothetical protein